MKKTILLIAGLAFFTFKNQAQTVTDIDGNVYDTIHIGNQVWLKQNLKVTHYNNGTSIPLVTDNKEWLNLTTPGYCWYNNDSATYGSDYGALYNWYTVNTGNLCPAGWLVPDDAKWLTLIYYLGGENVAGGKLKEAGYTHWLSPNTGATNSSGFTALPGGHRGNSGGSFLGLGSYGDFWSATEATGSNAWYWNLVNTAAAVYRYNYYKTYGFSVRCLKDNSTNIEDINFKEKFNIYPNPAIERVYIDCADRKDSKMQVYNIIGDCVFQGLLTSGTNEVDISSLTTGIYIIQLTGADGTFRRKLIKE